MRTLTAANSVLMLSVVGLFDTPVRIQGFAADNIFDMGDIAPNETVMGVDGLLSGGYVPVPKVQGYTVQGDSASIDIFERWYSAMLSAREVYIANGSTYLPAIGKKYTQTRGFLTGYKPMSDGQKLLQPRKFVITWQDVTSAAI